MTEPRCVTGGEPSAIVEPGPGRRGPGRWADVAAVALGAVLALAMPGRAESLLSAATVVLWWGAVVVVIRSDLARFIIPDGASATIAVLGLIQAGCGAAGSGLDGRDATLACAAALSNGVAAFCLFWLSGRIFRVLGGREALGFGDVKLAGASAIWLDPADAAAALEVAALAALAVLLLRGRGPLRGVAVPFGAFMAPAAWLVFVLGPAVRGDAGPPPW